MRFGARIVLALGGAAVLGLGGFLAWQEGLPTYHRAQEVPAVSASETLALPQRVYDPPPFVRSTKAWGPPGPVGLVFQGRTARDGFTGEISSPWYAVSARTGDYWRLSAPHLDDAQGRLFLAPDGARVAWAWPGGIGVYDLVTGETRTYPEAAGAAPGRPLAWSPDGGRIAFDVHPIRVLDVEAEPGAADAVRDLALQGPNGSRVAPAWTASGRWLTVPMGDGVEAVEVAETANTAEATAAAAGGSGGTGVVDLEVGRFLGGVWGSSDTFAGVHPKAVGQVVRNVVRVVHTAGLAGDPEVRVVDASPEGLVIDGLWGWVDRQEVVLTGLSPATGSLERAMVMSLEDSSLRPYMSFPTQGDNWAGIQTVSLAGDLLKVPTLDYEAPLKPWAPGAKLITCMLVAMFPMTYFLLARRPKR